VLLRQARGRVLVAVNKADLEPTKKLRARTRRKGTRFVSALTGEGLPPLANDIAKLDGFRADVVESPLDVSPTLALQARLLRQHQWFEGDPSFALGLTPLRQEYVRGYRLGAYWEYTRRLHYQLAFDHGERESNILGRNYRYNAGVAQARFVF